jgi:hypothetical protein
MDAAEWGAVASGAAAVATALAGFLALVAAKWTVDATKKASEKSDAALKAQIEVQREELDVLKGQHREVARRETLYAAYMIFRAAGLLEEHIQKARKDGVLNRPVSPETVTRVEACYPLSILLSRENYMIFQLMDAIAHGEQFNNEQHVSTVVERLNELRRSLTPAIVGLPEGTGSRVYGHDGMSALEASADAKI